MYKKVVKGPVSASQMLIRYSLIACCIATCLAFDALQSKFAWAVSLGPAQVHSNLGAPLSVSMELSHLGAVSVEQLRASLASEEHYKQMGVNRTNALPELNLAIEQGSDGKVRLLITSKQRFNEPYLNVLVHIRWPKGQLLKEVTLLSNPPKLAQ